MGDLVDLEEYKRRRQEEELDALQEELDSLIREQMLYEIEQIGYECYDLTNDEKAELGLNIATQAYYVVVSPWIFYTMGDEFEE